MRRIRFRILIIFLIAIMCSLCIGFFINKYYIEIDHESFISVQGKNLLTNSGREYRIKGISFGNNVWYRPKSAPVTDHDEKSFEEIAQLGFNTVRFYINYDLFEDDDRPYEYKASGFEWLDQNIEWAKKHRIRLIINMHVPQGGFLSRSNISFWQTENMERFRSLWLTIAKRYQEETTILGYGLLNEPYMPYYKNPDQALNLYYSFIKDVMGDIRKVDSKHIIFLEKPYGCVNTADNEVTYPWRVTESFQIVGDTNVAYEYHFYDKFEFTSQKQLRLPSFRDWYYGDDTRIILSGNRDWKAALDFEPIDIKTVGDWTLVTSSLLQLRDQGNTGFWYMTISNSNRENNVYIDDVTIKEYDTKGKYLRDIYQYDFGNGISFVGSSSNTDGGQCEYDSENGYLAPGCAKVNGVDGRYKFSITYNDNNFFRVKDGNYYQLTLQIKTTNQSVAIIPGIQMQEIEKLYTLNKDYLESQLRNYLDWSDINNVPIYLGEFGASGYIMGNEYKGEEWVRDMFELLNQYGMHYNYHDYRDENYGLYMDDGLTGQQHKNRILYQIFKTEVK